MKDFSQYGNRPDEQWEMLPWIPDPRPPFKIWVKPEQIAPFFLIPHHPYAISLLLKINDGFRTEEFRRLGLTGSSGDWERLVRGVIREFEENNSGEDLFHFDSDEDVFCVYSQYIDDLMMLAKMIRAACADEKTMRTYLGKIEYIKLFWEGAPEGEPSVILYEVDTENERLALRSIDISADGRTRNIPDLYDGAIEITPIPTVEELNAHVWGEEFHACLIEKAEFEAIWESQFYSGALGAKRPLPKPSDTVKSRSLPPPPIRTSPISPTAPIWTSRTTPITSTSAKMRPSTAPPTTRCPTPRARFWWRTSPPCSSPAPATSASTV